MLYNYVDGDDNRQGHGAQRSLHHDLQPTTKYIHTITTCSTGLKSQHVLMTKHNIFSVLDRIHSLVMEGDISDPADVIELLYDEFENEFGDNSDFEDEDALY